MKNKKAFYTVFACLLVLLPVLSACTDTTEPPPTTTPPPTNETLLPTVEGIDPLLVYASKCAVCHGSEAQGGVGPGLTRDISIAFLSQWIPVHRTGVDLDPRLSNVLINWLKVNSTVSTTPKPTDPVFVYALNCAVCHGATLSGGNGGPAIREINLTRLTEGNISVFLQGHYSGVDLVQEQRDLLAEWLKASP